MEENIELDDELQLKEVVIENKPDKKKRVKVAKPTVDDEEPLVNCLRNEIVIIRHINKPKGIVKDPKHVLFGGLAENASRTYTVPKLSSGMYVNVLTDAEKTYLENIMGLEYNALSIYKKENNFWSSASEDGISSVTLYKQDNRLDLSDPRDYIRYKILLANKNFIAPNLQVLEDKPKATYEFVIISEGEESKKEKLSMSITMQCYKEYGKIEGDKEKLKTIVEIIDGRPVAKNTQLEFLQSKINTLIQSNSKLFLKVVTDPYLDTKVLIKNAVNAGIIGKRGDYFYLRKDNTPLCNIGEEPTFNLAAKFLNGPKQQDLKFSIEAQLK